MKPSSSILWLLAAGLLPACGNSGIVDMTATPVNPPTAAAAKSRVVVAVLDSALNPYHEFFYAGSPIYAGTAPSSVTPEVLAELGVASADQMQLTRSGDLAADVAADAAAGLRECITMHGNDYATTDGSCIRDYVHVSDLADAHVLALRSLLEGAASTAYNLGNGEGYSVLEVIEAAQCITTKEIPVSIGPRREGDPPRLVGDATFIKNTLGWAPKFSDLNDIIGSAWLWHRRTKEQKSN